MFEHTNLKHIYENYCSIQSDINQHLPTLRHYASKCNTAIELGVRGCISSYALAYGLLENKNGDYKELLLNDINQCDVTQLVNAIVNSNLKIKEVWCSDLEITVDKNYDLVFIDTWHVYAQLKRELAKFGPITNKYIIMHDTTIDGVDGETIRNGWDAKEQSTITGFTVDEINKGLWPAIMEFLQNNTDWVLNHKFTNNNGLTILERINGGGDPQ